MQYTLTPPLFVKVQGPTGTVQEIDVYAARRVLADAEKKPSEELRWDTVLGFLAETFGVEPNRLAENNALEFQELINTLVLKANEHRKKKLDEIVFSPDSFPESQTTSENGA